MIITSMTLYSLTGHLLFSVHGPDYVSPNGISATLFDEFDRLYEEHGEHTKVGGWVRINSAVGRPPALLKTTHLFAGWSGRPSLQPHLSSPSILCRASSSSSSSSSSSCSAHSTRFMYSDGGPAGAVAVQAGRVRERGAGVHRRAAHPQGEGPWV